MTPGAPILALLLACATSSEAPPENACEGLYADAPGPSSEAEIAAMLDEVRVLFPSLDGVEIGMVSNQSDTSYYAANLDLGTLADPPLERRYLLNWSELVLDDPPSRNATVAVLAHELAHIEDYLDMDGEELAAFGVWYATSDVSEYERGTDLTSMEKGCAVGLIDFRLWLYDHVDAETEAQKRVDYWTPEEIAAWIADPRR